MVSAPPTLTPASSVVVARIYAEAEAILYRRIARRLAQGIDSPGWAGRKLSDVLKMRAELETEIARAGTAAARQAIAGLTENYDGGYRLAVSEMRRAGVDMTGNLGARGNRPALRALANETVQTLDTLQPRILRSSLDVYRATVAEASGVVLTGSQTRLNAAQSVLDRFATRGITGFFDSAGRGWDAATYAEMATRTAVLNASRVGHEQTLTANGLDLVIVSTGFQSCPACDPWEGKVLSLTGDTSGYPTMDDARQAGLFHPNCRHRTGAFIPGLTREAHSRPLTEAREHRYELTQEQRYNERQIRAWRRREEAAMSDSARDAASSKVREWQDRNRVLVAAEGLSRKYERESITRAR